MACAHSWMLYCFKMSGRSETFFHIRRYYIYDFRVFFRLLLLLLLLLKKFRFTLLMNFLDINFDAKPMKGDLSLNFYTLGYKFYSLSNKSVRSEKGTLSVL